MSVERPPHCGQVMVLWSSGVSFMMRLITPFVPVKQSSAWSEVLLGDARTAPRFDANIPKLATNCLASQMLVDLRVAFLLQRPPNVRHVGASAGARQFEGSLNSLLHIRPRTMLGRR